MGKRELKECVAQNGIFGGQYLVQMKSSSLESVLTINLTNKIWLQGLGWGLEEWGAVTGRRTGGCNRDWVYCSRL